MRPKCTVLDEQGRLAIGKFPSQGDERSITQQCNPAGVHMRHFQVVDALK